MTTPLISASWNDSMATERNGKPSTPLYAFSVAQEYLRMICPPFILVFGIFGNVMIIVIMRRMTSGESAIHMYFMVIAVFDTISLCTLVLGRWMLYTFGFSVSATHVVVCKIYAWLYTGGGTISCWCLVCMTVHRALSVVWPHRVNVLCTRRTVAATLAAVTVFFALLYSHYIIGLEWVYVPTFKSHWCAIRSDNESYIYFFQHVFIYIELSIYSLLPFTFLAASNSVLVWKLGVSAQEVARKCSQGDSEQGQARRKAANAVTLTVSVVSMAFIVLTLPSCVTFILHNFAISKEREQSHELARNAFVTEICELLGQTNSAVNFYLYCLTGRRFREEFIKVMCCVRDRGRRTDGASSLTGGGAVHPSTHQ